MIDYQVIAYVIAVTFVKKYNAKEVEMATGVKTTERKRYQDRDALMVKLKRPITCYKISSGDFQNKFCRNYFTFMGELSPCLV